MRVVDRFGTSPERIPPSRSVSQSFLRDKSYSMYGAGRESRWITKPELRRCSESKVVPVPETLAIE